MTTAPFMDRVTEGPLTGSVLDHALHVLAEATNSTAVLFDAAGRPILGPAAGSGFIRQLLATDLGRKAVLASHGATIHPEIWADGGDAAKLFRELNLDHIAVPIVRDGQTLGTLTLGDRSRRRISPVKVRHLAWAVGLDPDRLQESAAQVLPWSEHDASATRNMGSLLVELLADLFRSDEDLRARIEELSTVYNVAGMFAGKRDLQEILNRIAVMVCDVMKVKACSIRLLDEETGELHIKAVHNLSEEYLRKGPVSVEKNPIDEAAVAGEIIRVANMPADPRTLYPEQARKEGIVSSMVCGMIYRGKAVGVIRVYTGEEQTFTPYEEALLRAVALQAAAAIVHAQLVSEALESERYERQLEYAGSIQRRMIPANPPEMERIEIGTIYRPTFQVGGDFYDLIQLPKGNLGVGIADVAGKGVPAALLMSSLRSALRVCAYFTYDVDHIMAEVNRHMSRDTTTREFITTFYGVITPDGRRLTYCNAGHDPPMLLRDGKIQRLETGGLVLGVDCFASYDRGLLELQPGDILLLYTDGAVEAANFNDELYGQGRLIDSLKRYADQPAPLLTRNIDWDIRRFQGLADRTDDLTLVALKIK